MEWENNEERSACCWNNTNEGRLVNMIIIIVTLRNNESQVFISSWALPPLQTFKTSFCNYVRFYDYPIFFILKTVNFKISDFHNSFISNSSWFKTLIVKIDQRLSILQFQKKSIEKQRRLNVNNRSFGKRSFKKRSFGKRSLCTKPSQYLLKLWAAT